MLDKDHITRNVKDSKGETSKHMREFNDKNSKEISVTRIMRSRIEKRRHPMSCHIVLRMRHFIGQTKNAWERIITKDLQKLRDENQKRQIKILRFAILRPDSPERR